MKTKPIWTVIAVLLLVGFGWFANGAGAAEPPLVTREWTVDGVVRKGLVHVPASAATRETPVVFAFHGHGGTMAQAARSFGYHTLWPEAVVVYLQGLPTPGALTDPAGKLPGWQKAPGDQGDRDLKFFDAVFATLKKECKVDAKRVFVTGHSNGGAFTYLLWAERGGAFAAVAPSAAVPGLAWFKQLTAKPALHVAGTNDELVKYPMQERAIAAVRKLNGCDATGAPWAKSGPLTGTLYPSKTDTPLVTLIHPGTHTFPAEAPALIVRFFKEQTGLK
ncbi:MAG: prolyl oligopeptidase family serine peptidase [Verrucomicrobia bacterium]|nr:prolyl oligopeptidase family serine peptidase [Verrucomicrobiota bacterium]